MTFVRTGPNRKDGQAKQHQSLDAVMEILNEHFRQRMVHYATQAKFCYPGKANEKGLVEGLERRVL